MTNDATKTGAEGFSGSPDVESLRVEINSLKADLKSLKTDQRELTTNLITIFGVFASIVTFLSVEVQILKTINQPFILIGLSLLLISIIFSLIYAIDVVVKSETKMRLSHPLISLSLIALFLAFLSFATSFIFNNEDSCSQQKCFSQFKLK